MVDMVRISEEAPINVDELMEIMGEDRELVRDCLADFVGEFEGMMGAIRDAAGIGDGESLEQAAHALKGSLTYLAAKPAAEAASKLEKSGRNKTFLTLEADLASLERECGKLGAFIKGFSP
ncbi:Hpt domain-containing protein [Desulfoluna sp.]|uniref:Hpt domain-containing protein n=1 Tax=Desulfoluna sp. TaxID=2045199 RepID=UPI00262BB0F1|nr:Hpt domain-containing protein [Desulfoluna sp.]